MRLGNFIRGCVLLLLCGGEAAAQQSPLIGTWLSTLNPGTTAVIYVTLSIQPGGKLQEQLMNRFGVAYQLFGTYEFDASTGMFQFIFTDYAPKQLCSPLGCQPAPVPPDQLNIKNTAQLTFPNPNQMVGTAADGSTMIWGRTN
jgi:hypothetical protein